MPETKLVQIETPIHPGLKMTDNETCAHTVLKPGNIILVMDNTFMSTYFQWPLALRAGIYMYSATKDMNHQMLQWAQCHLILCFLQNSLGAVPSPVDCYLHNKGLKTL